MADKVYLTAEDKKKFSDGVAEATPAEIILIASFVKLCSNSFPPSDLQYMYSCIGRRCEKILRTLIKIFCFKTKDDD
jgi:hypothetical protein